MTETLYIILERTKRSYWRAVRIAKVSKKKPQLKRPSEQALIKLQLDIPDKILEPVVVRVEVKPEHIVAPTVAAQSVQP